MKTTTEIKKIELELENVKNTMQLEEQTCEKLQQEATGYTSSLTQFTQEFEYYNKILINVQKELKETTHDLEDEEEEPAEAGAKKGTKKSSRTKVVSSTKKTTTRTES